MGIFVFCAINMTTLPRFGSEKIEVHFKRAICNELFLAQNFLQTCTNEIRGPVPGINTLLFENDAVSGSRPSGKVLTSTVNSGSHHGIITHYLVMSFSSVPKGEKTVMQL